MHHYLRSLLLLAAAAGLSASAARAATSPPGVNLRWNQCFGDGGVQYRDFACNTNTGSERLVGTFELAQDLPAVRAVYGYLNVASSTQFLPQWWTLKFLGSCRPLALSATPALPSGSVACADWAAGQASLSVDHAVLTSYSGYTEGLRIAVSGAVPAGFERNLVAGQEYHAFSLQISHAKTVGIDACGGCLEPAVIYFSALKLEQSGGIVTTLWNGANYSGSQWVSWQQGYPIDQVSGCTQTGGGLFCLFPYVAFNVVPYSVTPARGVTWGRLKSMYR